MKQVAIHNIAPRSARRTVTANSAPPTAQDWAELSEKVDDLAAQIASIDADAIMAAITEGLRPVRAEFALREKEAVRPTVNTFGFTPIAGD